MPQEGEVSEHTWHQAENTVTKPDIPVRLGTSRDRGRVVWSVVPHRVDLEEPRNQGDDTGDNEEEATSFGRIDRSDRVAYNVPFLASGARVLRVFVNHDHEQVNGDHQDDERWHDHDVERVQAWNDVNSGEFTTEEEERQVGTNNWDSQHHAVDNA